jgi:hypothetical protein
MLKNAYKHSRGDGGWPLKGLTAEPEPAAGCLSAMSLPLFPPHHAYTHSMRANHCRRRDAPRQHTHGCELTAAARGIGVHVRQPGPQWQLRKCCLADEAALPVSLPYLLGKCLTPSSYHFLLVPAPSFPWRARARTHTHTQAHAHSRTKPCVVPRYLLPSNPEVLIDLLDDVDVELMFDELEDIAASGLGHMSRGQSPRLHLYSQASQTSWQWLNGLAASAACHRTYCLGVSSTAVMLGLCDVAPRLLRW